MAYIDDVLAYYTDYELAVFYNYKLADYLPETQNKIRNYIFNDRGLTNDSISDFLSKMGEPTPRDGLVSCPRCKSSKLQKDSIDGQSTDFSKEWVEASNPANEMFEIPFDDLPKYGKVTCIVCGYELYSKEKLEDEKTTTRGVLYSLFGAPKSLRFFKLMKFSK